MFNLLVEKWLPVVRANGKFDCIAPWEIVECFGDDSPVELMPPRPDFKAALMEFLVGLYQTAFPPMNKKEWRKLLEEPPSTDEVRAAFEPHEQYFNLFGERPLFMQDFALKAGEPKDLLGVSSLLIDAPGGKTVRDNGDFFVKRGRVEQLCPACAAAALFTLQAFAPSGGKGHRTSLRGGGPLSTLMAPAGDGSLWERVWFNVMPLEDRYTPFEKQQPQPEDFPGKVYPWAAPTRTSEKGEETFPDDVLYQHAYWGMPRRILLSHVAEAGHCDLCGETAEVLVREYTARHSGFNYHDTWIHPLTPYRGQGEGKVPFSIKGQAGITGYSHWLGIVYGQTSGESVKGKMNAATCVTLARRMLKKSSKGYAVNASGYDMDNMKARNWCDGTFPCYEEPTNPDFRECIDLMVQAADVARRNLVGAIKDALVNEAGKNQAKIDKGLFAKAGTAFWGATEDDFYGVARDVLKGADFGETEPQREKWSKTVQDAALDCFDKEVSRFQLQPKDYKRHAEARSRLFNFNRKKVRSTLNLSNKRGDS